ncbi:MAG: MliC family protein [Sutterellaceae bacterium]|nr:MliC family protein [Sutterellaceae bacterium]MDD7442339.1 MliC family protein [Sutterellaceae bacterium]MDY2868553.1 MliC family protein [Mesosutterella sp.]
MKKLFAVSAAALLLALASGCSSTVQIEKPAAHSGAASGTASFGDHLTKAIYACDNGRTLDVIYVNTASGNAWAVITQLDELIPMAVTTSASGATYKAINPAYTYRLYTKGNEAMLEADGSPLLSGCRRQ